MQFSVKQKKLKNDIGKDYSAVKARYERVKRVECVRFKVTVLYTSSVSVSCR